MKTVIEVGAHKGGDTEIWLRDPNTTVFAFEPAPKHIKVLKKKFSNFSNFYLTETAVDIVEEEKVFNISKGCSSLHEFADNLKQLWPDRHHWEVLDKVTVNTIRLDNFVKEKNIKQIDYLWIDAQGNDFRVLQSLGKYISIVQEGRCEAAYNIALYKDVVNDVDSIVTWLDSQGFNCVIVPDNWNKEADIHFKRK
jgi:FkbM family methyltransferase